MDSMMDVVVERPILMPEMDDDAGGVSDSGSTVVNSDTNTEGNTSHTNTEGEKTSEHASGKESTGGEKSDRKSRKKKDRRKKDKKERTERERGDKKNKTESVKALEEENAQLKNDLNDLQLRLVYLEARDHNKELKLIHLQKELEETRSILIEKEGDCVEWEQIDREKDKTVISLNQTIAILQRDLTVLLEEKESSHTPKKHHVKKTNRLVFSPKPEEVFEYPREEDYDSDEELTSDYEDEEDEEEDNGAPVEPSEDETNEEEETNEVIEKEVDESEITTNPAVFFPFPSLSTLPAEPVYVAAPQEPIIENPLVKIFSPTVPPSHLNFGADSPTLSHNSASPSPSPSPSPTPSPQQNTNKPHPPSSAPPSHKTNGAPPPTHPNGNSPRQSISPSNSASNLSVKTDSNHHQQQQQQSQTSPTHPTSPSQTHFPDVDLPMNVSVRELRSMWENPKSSVSSSPNNSSTRLK